MVVQPLEGALAQTPLAPLAGLTEGAGIPPIPGVPDPLGGGDAISRMLPPWMGGGMLQNPLESGLNPLAGLMQQLMSMLQAMMGYGGGGMPPPPTSPIPVPTPGTGGEQFFGSANGASEGDPHLSFNGNHWSSMVSQPNLLESNSIPGGFRISTQVTQPNAKGVSWNQSATVALNGGATTVSLDSAGQPSIVRNGQPVAIADGQTLQLGNGDSVTCNGNGTLTVNAGSRQGGHITTTLTAKGEGVNVDVNAQNVDLGGSLVNGGGTTGIGIPQPPPVASPIGVPIGSPSPMPFAPPISGLPFPLGGFPAGGFPFGNLSIPGLNMPQQLTQMFTDGAEL